MAALRFARVRCERAERPEQLVEDVRHSDAVISSQLSGALVDEGLLRPEHLRPIRSRCKDRVLTITSGIRRHGTIRGCPERRFDPIRRCYDLADLTAETASLGVSATVLVQTVSATAESEEFLAGAAASGGLIAGIIGWVDLAAPSVVDELARLADAPGGERLVGIRHQVEDEPDSRWMGRADVSGGQGALGRAGPVYDLLDRADGVVACVEVADALEEVQFVLDRRQTTDRGWSAGTTTTSSSSVAVPTSPSSCRGASPRPAGRHGLQPTSLPSSTTCSTPSAPAARCSAPLGRCASWPPATKPRWPRRGADGRTQRWRTRRRVRQHGEPALRLGAALTVAEGRVRGGVLGQKQLEPGDVEGGRRPGHLRLAVADRRTVALRASQLRRAKRTGMSWYHPYAPTSTGPLMITGAGPAAAQGAGLVAVARTPDAACAASRERPERSDGSGVGRSARA